MPTVSSTLKAIEGISGAYGTGAANNTPAALAREMVNKLNVDWSNPDLKIFDPCCGFGTFLVVVYEKLREHGHLPKHIVENMIYGNDISKTKAKIAAAVLSKLAENDTTIYNVDALEGGFDDMQFDVVLGNPPYQKSKDTGERSDQASNLWTIFWVECLKKFSKQDGIVALITPTSWLSPSSDVKGDNKIGDMNRLWDIFDRYDSYAEVNNVSKHFPGVGSTFGYVIVDKSKNTGLKFSNNQPKTLGFLPNSEIEFCIENLSKDNNLKNKFGILQRANKNSIRVSIPMTRSLKDDSFEILTGDQLPSKGSDKEGLYFYIATNTMEEAEKVQKRLIECKDILQKHCKWSGFVNARIVEMIKYE